MPCFWYYHDDKVIMVKIRVTRFWLLTAICIYCVPQKTIQNSRSNLKNDLDFWIILEEIVLLAGLHITEF